MTITSSTARVDYLGTDIAGPYVYPFKIFAASHLVVTATDPSGGTMTLHYPTDYQVSGVNNPNGGTVTLTRVLADGWGLTIARVVPLLQLTDLRNQGRFTPSTYEDAVDYLTMAVQQIGEGQTPPPTPTQSLIAFGAIPNDLTVDNTAAVQAWIDASSDTGDAIGYSRSYPAGTAPAGIFRCTGPVQFNKKFVTLMGQGQNNTIFFFDGLADGIPYWTAAGIPYLEPCLSGFSITNINPVTGVENGGYQGRGMDLSPVTTQVYGTAIRDLTIYSSGHGFVAPRFFSMQVDTLWCASKLGHSIVAACGPSVTWRNCSAIYCGDTMAGFRMTGTVRLIGCNGIFGTGGYWGIFGSNPSAVDDSAPYAADFPTLSYADVVIEGPNVEAYVLGGIWVINPMLQLTLRGGGVVRNLPGDYLFDIRVYSCFSGAAGTAAVRLDSVRRLVADGAPAHKIIFDAGGAVLVENDAILTAWDGFYSTAAGIDYPVVRVVVSQDEYDSRALDITRVATDVALVRDKLRVQGTVQLEGTTGTPGGGVRYIGTGVSDDIWFHNVPSTGRHAWAVNDVEVGELNETNLKVLTQVYSPMVADVIAGSSWTVDWRKGNTHFLALANGAQSLSVTGARDGATYRLVLQQPASGAAGTITWAGGVWLWDGGSAPSLSSTNGYTDLVEITYSLTLGMYLGKLLGSYH